MMNQKAKPSRLDTARGFILENESSIRQIFVGNIEGKKRGGNPQMNRIWDKNEDSARKCIFKI